MPARTLSGTFLRLFCLAAAARKPFIDGLLTECLFFETVYFFRFWKF